MRKKSLILCGFTVIMGIFGAFLRWLQNMNAFETDTGLELLNSPLSWGMALFTLIVAVLLWVFVQRLDRRTFAPEYPETYAKAVPFLSVFSGLVGALIAVGGVLTVIRCIGSSKSVFDLLLGFFSLLAAVGVAGFLFGIGKPRSERKTGFFGAIVSVFYLCFWLIASYKYSAADPVIWHFALRLLSISAAILAFYFIAGFVFNRPRPRAALYFSLLGTFLCITVLADSYPLGEQLITAGFAGTMLLLAFSQLGSAEARD